jgi:hypothetical protein
MSLSAGRPASAAGQNPVKCSICRGAAEVAEPTAAKRAQVAHRAWQVALVAALVAARPDRGRRCGAPRRCSRTRWCMALDSSRTCVGRAHLHQVPCGGGGGRHACGLHAVLTCCWPRCCACTWCCPAGAGSCHRPLQHHSTIVSAELAQLRPKTG